MCPSFYWARFKESPPVAGFKRVNQVKNVNSEIKLYLKKEENLKKVLIGQPNELDSIKTLFATKKDKILLERIINYDGWENGQKTLLEKDYGPYNLAVNLDIPTCVYCNRLYTKTVVHEKQKKITRPVFDHWFPKSKFPLLQLSFYNLIPCCTICNSGAKGSSVFEISNFFHPYVKKEDLDYSFSYEYKDYSDFKFKIKTSNEFSEKSVKAFHLEDIYKTHEDEISDLRAIKDSYSPAYLSSLKSIMKASQAISDEEIYRLAFGVHLEEDKFDRRPLSKMKRDILKELGIIN